MTRPIQGRQVDIGNAAHGVIVQYQGSFDVKSAAALVEVGRAEIGSGLVQAHAHIGAAAGLSELDESSTHFFHPLPQLFQRRLCPAHRYRVVPAGQSLSQVIHGLPLKSDGLLLGSGRLATRKCLGQRSRGSFPATPPGRGKDMATVAGQAAPSDSTTPVPSDPGRAGTSPRPSASAIRVLRPARPLDEKGFVERPRSSQYPGTLLWFPMIKVD